MNHHDETSLRAGDEGRRTPQSTVGSGRLPLFMEVLGVVGCFFLFSCGAVPDVNEAHYWTKARHFWDPSFAAGDLFLESADAHWSFYWTLGQFTRWLPLDTATWVGRWCVWTAMALGWVAFSRVFDPRWGMSILTAALMVVATRWFHLSGEWVVGGAEAKGLAFGCFFYSLSCACRGKWAAAYIAGGAAAGFHVLVGGWLVLCLLLTSSGCLFRSWQTGQLPSRDTFAKDTRATLGGLFVGGALSLFGLIPGLALAWNASPQISQQANVIYVLLRLPHHLVFSSFSPTQLLAFCILAAGWLLLQAMRMGTTAKQTQPHCGKIITLVNVALFLSACGVVLSWSLSAYGIQPLAVSLLRYYWFRTADVLLPVGCVMIGLMAMKEYFSLPSDAGQRLLRGTLLALALALPISMELHQVWTKNVLDARPNADQAGFPNDPDPARNQAIHRNWLRVCRWIREQTPEDALFLTPRMQHTFKWYTGRREVVNWKDVPQDNKGLVEWWQRVQDCSVFWTSDFRLSIQEPILIHELTQKYDVDFIVMPQYAYDLQQRFGNPLPYRLVYPETPEQKTSFVVLSVKQW